MNLSDTKRTDLPLLTAVLAVTTFLAVPIVFTLVLSTWADSGARQIVAGAGLLTLLSFTFVRRKYDTLLLALIFFSQFAVSLHTFELQEPVKLQVFFSDVLFLVFFFAGLETRRSWWPDKFGWLVCLFVAWVGVTTYFSAHRDQSLLFLSWQLKFLFLYLFVRQVHASDSLIRWILYTVTAILIIQSILAVAQVWTGHWLGLEILGERSIEDARHYLVKGSLRVGGTLGATNAFGAYLAALLVLITPFVMLRFNVLYAVGSVFGLVAIILCLTRAAWLSMLIGVVGVILAMLQAKLISLSRAALLTMAGMFVLLVGIGIYFDKIADRFQDREAISSARGRFAQITDAWKVIENHQATGIGPGVTQFFGRWRKDSRYIRDALPDVSMSNQVHSSQLQIWIESGTFGFIVFLAIIFGTFWSIVQASRPRPGETSLLTALRIGSACAAFAIMIDISFGTELNHTQLFTLFWIFAAFSHLNTQGTATETQTVSSPAAYTPVTARMLA